ncbi:MAG TPA: peptide ABC transporter substrate-binding protein [Gammaproteobacteria bacterium]
MSRAAVRQLVWLGVLGAAALVGLMGALAWAASLTRSDAEAFGAVDFERNAISIRLRQEPPQLDSTRTRDTESGKILGHIKEGLLRYDARNEVAPGVAERWEIRPDGATFWLREDARWSDGRPVTAHDFVFAWRTVVDPATAADYAFLLYVVENAEAINNGELPPAALGVRAVGDRVLEVRFARPAPYFDKLVVFPTYFPVREDFYRSRQGRYGADAWELLSNGPFVLTRWVHGASMRLEKNPFYWDRDAVKLEVIEIPYITPDTKAALNLYRDGEIADVLQLDAEALEQALDQRWPLARFADGSVWFLMLNHRPGRLTANYHFRKALQLVNDPGEVVNKVLKIPSYSVADSLFPSWLRGEHDLLKREYPPPPVQRDDAAAREHLEMARRELGLDRFPPIVLLSDDTPGAVTWGEYLQSHWRSTLGLDVILDRQIFKLRLEKAEQGDFDVVLYGWGPDYDDPLTFGDLFASWNLNNHGRYVNPELDAQIRIAQMSVDPRERMAAFGEIQRIILEDVVIIPTYERGQMYIQHPSLKGVVHRAIGTEVDYTRAYLVRDP